MIAAILQSFLSVLIPVAVGALILFAIGLRFIFKKRVQGSSVSVTALQENKTINLNLSLSANDMRAIAGDDVMSTQLDLARAFIEAGKKQLARQILEQVIAQGSEVQQLEAQQLAGMC